MTGSLEEQLSLLAGDNDNVNEIRRLVDSAVAEGFEHHAPKRQKTIGEAFCRAMQKGCLRGQLEVVRYFVEERNLDPEFEDFDDHSALHTACYLHESSCAEVAKYLIETARSDVNAWTESNKTPLHCACAYNNRHEQARLGLVKYLVEEGGTSVNALDDDGRPALYYAFCCCAQSDVSRYLIPRTVLTPTLFRIGWRRDMPIDIKLLLVKTYTRQQVSERPCGYWNKFPLHAAFYAPLPLKNDVLELVNLIGPAKLCHLDCDGRLPVHIALDSWARSKNGDSSAFTILSIDKLIELEPRSSFVRDPTTRLYPFEMAAMKPRKANEEEEEIHEETLAYKLLRCNPERLLRGRHGCFS